MRTINLHTKLHELDCFPWDDAQPDSGKTLEGLKAENEWVPLRESKPKRFVEITNFTFPEFGEARCYNPKDIETPFVAELAGIRWKITIEMDYEDGGYPRGGSVRFEETTEPLTPYKPATTRNSRVFGQPSFLQGEYFPHYKGKCAGILAVIETGWGDCGNENLFLALDENNLPCGLFHGADCC